MVTDKTFNVEKEPLKGAIAGLNSELAALQIEPSDPAPGSEDLYGEGVFGLRFSGLSRLGALLDNVSRVMWPEDPEAVLPTSADNREHLIVCANFPDGSTEALQFFTTFRPGKAPWITEEADELRAMGEIAVNIDSSAKLKKDPSRIPDKYQAPVSAYLLNLHWLTITNRYEAAIIEVNEHMKNSLGRWGVELTDIEGARPRLIGGEPYERLVIDPSTPINRGLVELVRECPPITFQLDEKGSPVVDKVTSKAA